MRGASGAGRAGRADRPALRLSFVATTPIEGASDRQKHCCSAERDECEHPAADGPAALLLPGSTWRPERHAGRYRCLLLIITLGRRVPSRYALSYFSCSSILRYRCHSNRQPRDPVQL